MQRRRTHRKRIRSGSWLLVASPAVNSNAVDLRSRVSSGEVMGTHGARRKRRSMARGPSRAVPRSPRSPRGQSQRNRHAHQGSRRQRAGRAQVGRDRRHHEAARRRPMPSVLTEYRGLTVTDLATLRAALRPGVDRLQGLQEHARPPGRGRRRLHRDGRAARGPGGDRLRPPRRRRGDRGQGAARLRQDATRTWCVKGGMLGPRRADRRATSRRSPTCRPATCCSPASPAGSRPRS